MTENGRAGSFPPAGGLRRSGAISSCERSPNCSPDRSAAVGADTWARAMREGSGEESWFGSAGWGFSPGGGELWALFELAEAFRFPQSAEEGDAPFSPEARMLWHLPDGGLGGGDLSVPHALYWPTPARHQGQPVGPPPLAPPARCAARWNRQSGRWEVMAPGPQWRRFEMTAALSCGGSAEARTIVFDHNGAEHRGTPPGEVITVHDALAIFSKPPTVGNDPGALGTALFAADRNRWEIVALQTPGDFFGLLAQDCHRWDATAAVWPDASAFVGGYNPFGPSAALPAIVLNPVGGGNQTIGPPSNLPAHWFSGRQGDRVFCRWHIRGGYYYIAGVEPNDLDYQPLDVLTRTTLAIDFSAQSFTHRRYARQIKLPPWTTIGPEVEQ